MIVLRSPKGWTGPKVRSTVEQIEGTFRAHQVPLLVDDRPSRTSRAYSTAGCAATNPTSSSIRPGGCYPTWLRWLPKGDGGWAPTRTPTAG